LLSDNDVCRYKLLLEDVIKNTPESHRDKENLKEALTQIEAVAWHINEQLREHENRCRITEIINLEADVFKCV
jgi:hypothetical protein